MRVIELPVSPAGAIIGLLLGLLCAWPLARLLAAEPQPATHAYRQGQQDALEDCRTAGKVRIGGKVWECTGGSTE